MEEAILYWGRYPIPLEYNDIMPDVGVDDNERKIINDLYLKTAKYLYKSVKNGWESGHGEFQSIYYERYEDE